MTTTTITLDVRGTAMPVYEASPDSPNGAAVVVIQEAFGVNSHIEDVTRRFAALGYHAVAPHLFHRLDRQVVPYEDPSYVGLLEQLDDDEMLADVDAAVAHLNGLGFANEKIALVGFCMGGRVSFLVAARRRLGTCVGYYGGGIAVQRRANLPALLDQATHFSTSWLGLFGEEDPHIPMEEVEQVRTALLGAPVESNVLTFSGAGHGFNCDDRAAFHPEAARAAWDHTTQWLARTLRV